MASLKPIKRSKYSVNPFIGQENDSSDQKLQNVRDTLEHKLGYKRSPDQADFHEYMLLTTLIHFYGDELYSCLERVLAENPHWKKPYMQLLNITSPRRWGKTVSVGICLNMLHEGWVGLLLLAMFVAAMAACLPGLVQSIFSTGRRASELLLDLIYNILCKIPGMEERIYKKTNETIWIVGENSGDIRKIYSYPSKVKIASAFLAYLPHSLYVFWAYSLPPPKLTQQWQ